MGVIIVSDDEEAGNCCLVCFSGGEEFQVYFIYLYVWMVERGIATEYRVWIGVIIFDFFLICCIWNDLLFVVERMLNMGEIPVSKDLRKDFSLD